MPMRHSPQRSNDRDVADVNGSQRLKEATAPSRRLALLCTLARMDDGLSIQAYAQNGETRNQFSVK
jgi:hypothetical protein